MNINLIQVIKISIALLGAILGIFNTWHSLRKERVKLKVFPSNAYKFYWTINGNAKDEEGVSIDIINLSFFPITIAEIGFANFYLFANKLHDAKSIPLNFENLSGYSLPHRMEPRDSISFYLNESYLEKRDLFQKNKFAYAKTACGKFLRVEIKNLINLSKTIISIIKIPNRNLGNMSIKS